MSQNVKIQNLFEPPFFLWVSPIFFSFLFYSSGDSLAGKKKLRKKHKKYFKGGTKTACVSSLTAKTKRYSRKLATTSTGIFNSYF